LIIELDGDVHSTPEAAEYDSIRDNDLINLGLTVIRFPNKQVLTNIPFVLHSISNSLASHALPSSVEEGPGEERVAGPGEERVAGPGEERVAGPGEERVASYGSRGEKRDKLSTCSARLMC
jgi:hypothetical protein